MHFHLSAGMHSSIGEQRPLLSWMLHMECQDGVPSSDFLCSDRIMTGMTTTRSYLKCIRYSDSGSRCDIYVPSRRKSFSLIRWTEECVTFTLRWLNLWISHNRLWLREYLHFIGGTLFTSIISLSVPGWDRADSNMEDETYLTAESLDGSRNRTSSVFGSKPKRNM